MANVKLPAFGQEIVDLPPVCMVCGAGATVHKSKQFSWHPPWVGVLVLISPVIYIIVALILTKRQRIATPLCDRHSSYWWLFPALLVLSVLAIIGVGILGAMVVSAAD